MRLPVRLGLLRLVGLRNWEEGDDSETEDDQDCGSGPAIYWGSGNGKRSTQHVSAVNRFGQPKTVIHVVAYKFRDATSQNDQDQAIAGIKDMAAKIPGIKNIWLKTERNQIRDWSGVYVIESPAPKPPPTTRRVRFTMPGGKKWEQLRENSVGVVSSFN